MPSTMIMNHPYAALQLKERRQSADGPQMTFRRIMSLIAMAFLWTGSQIPVYIFGK